MLKPISETQNAPNQEPKVEEIPKGWLYVDHLPSEGKCYPKGTKILSRPLKVLELKHLATMTEDNADMVIDNVLKESVLGINYEDLVVADKIFLIMWQRSNTYRGDEFNIPFVCSECGHEGKYKFDVPALGFTGISEDYSMDTEYQIGEHKVQLDQFRIKTKIIMDNYVKEHPDVDIEILAGIAARIWKLDGQEVDLPTAYEYVVNMEPGDFVKLNALCEKTVMTLSPVVDVKCESCGKEVPVRVSFRGDFFLPSYPV